MKELKGIKIGKHFIEKPIIQGGMGVGISWDQLAGNVSKNGGLGTISAICTGYYQNMRFVKKEINGRPFGTENAYNREALFEIFKNARKICGDKPLACNILRAINDYERVVKDALEAGADIMAGSLIKNAGGGLAPTGGYIVGREDLVEDAAYQLTAPGLGDHMGSYAPGYRLFFQGLFMAPHVVLQALKGAVYTAAVGELLGYDVFPKVNADRYDLIQAINLKNGEEMEHFCVGMQAYSPVDAHVHPIPGDMPGYEDKIIMAGGTFVQGSSIELSADGPVRPPYTIFMQGGLVFEHSMLGILGAAEELLKHR